MHICLKCGKEFVSFKECLRHALQEHKDALTEEDIKLFKEWLEREWTCKDCIHYGNIYYDPYDEDGPLMKACPDEWLFNCPNPAEKCRNFTPREDDC